jgi:putative acetyltransferase
MYNLRKAEKGEEKKILDLIGLVLADYNLSVNARETDKDLADLEHFYFNNKGWFSVIDLEDKIIGSYGIYKMKDKTCELRKMYLLKNHQGQGLGRLMMEDALKKARELGYTEMILESNYMLDKANRLYKNYGFTEFKPEHLSDRCDYAMRKPL